MNFLMIRKKWLYNEAKVFVKLHFNIYNQVGTKQVGIWSGKINILIMQLIENNALPSKKIRPHVGNFILPSAGQFIPDLDMNALAESIHDIIVCSL